MVGKGTQHCGWNKGTTPRLEKGRQQCGQKRGDNAEVGRGEATLRLEYGQQHCSWKRATTLRLEKGGDNTEVGKRENNSEVAIKKGYHQP